MSRHSPPDYDPAAWPLAAWCDRSPRLRWPLVLILILLLWGLGGGVASTLEVLP